MRISISLLVLSLLSATAACDDGTGSAPSGGEFIAALQSPHGPEGAALLELTGEGIESVHGSSVSLFQINVNGGRRVMLVREPAGVIDFRVRVAPGHEPPQARVLQVVDADDQVRASTDGYRVTFTRTRGDE